MTEIIKGNLVQVEIDGEPKYGTVLSIVDDIYNVTYYSPSREEITRPFELNQLTKVGSHLPVRKQ